MPQSMTTRNHNSKSERNRLLRRCLKLREILLQARLSMTLEELTQCVNESTGEAWSCRTVKRDMNALIDLGYVRSIKGQGYIAAKS